MRIAVPREGPGERRVGMTPQVVLRLIEERHRVTVETDAGVRAGFSDDTYRDVGADVVVDPYPDAELIVVVGPPSAEQATRFPEGCALVGFLDPFTATDLVSMLTSRRI